MPLSFMKTGKEALKVAAQEKVKQEIRKESIGKAFRFFLGKGDKAVITFVDGDLDPVEGVLLPPCYYEHRTWSPENGWNNFYVCPKLTNPEKNEICPICDSGNQPDLVRLFTIIDHRVVQSKDGTKTYANQRRLLVVKPITFEMLAKFAEKYKGLAGVRFEVSRVGDKSAAVGDLFMFEEKETDFAKLRQMYTREITDPKTNQKKMVTAFEVLDYEKEITYRDGATLATMNIVQTKGASQVTSPAGSHLPSAPTDYDSVL